MKARTPRSMAWQVSAASVLSLLVAGGASANPPPEGRAAVVGGALPGGAIISARSIVLTPIAGGPATAAPIAADGSFRAGGLKAGHYTLRISSATAGKQTQTASFGEKVQSGLAQTGSALASGAQRGTMPQRISMNVTVGKRTSQPADVDGDGLDVEVGADGTLNGNATPRP
jgi:hypothetical protein